jgi:nucleoside-diphosphate-sugar epimerase/predicted dehydrogenase
VGGHERLADAVADAVIVAAPNALHVPASRLALERGRYVLCEKPLALSEADCAGLAALAADKGRLLKVAMSRRYLPTWRLAREMTARGELGAIVGIDVVDRAPFGWRPRSFAFFAPEAGGVLADMGVHYLDWLATLAGPLRPLSYADDARGGVESNLSFALESAAGAPVTLRLSRTRQGEQAIRIRCERGEIRIDKANEREIVVAADGAAPRRVASLAPFRNSGRQGAGRWPVSFVGSFCDMLADFEGALAGRGAGDLADGADAARTAALIAWAYAHRAPPPARKADAPGVLITGATGFIGGHLLERLAAAGEAVRVTARSPATLPNVARYAVDVAPTDVLDAAGVERAMQGIRTVYHLAVAGGAADERRITIEGTRNVVEAAIAAGAECVVVLSSMYVFGFPDSEQPLDETAPYRPYGGVYGESKAAMERWCLERARTSGATRIVVLNPSNVFGPGGGAYTTLPRELARAGGFAWIDGGAGACNYVFVDNLVDAMLRAAEAPAAHGQRFIVSDGAVSWREFLTPLVGGAADDYPSYSPAELAALHRRLERFQPRALARAVIGAPQVRAEARKSGVIRAASKLLGVGEAPPPAAAPAPASPCADADADAAAGAPAPFLAQLYGPAKTRFSSAKAEGVLGWRPRVALAEALALTRAWLDDPGA